MEPIVTDMIIDYQKLMQKYAQADSVYRVNEVVYGDGSESSLDDSIVLEAAQDDETESQESCLVTS